MLGYWDVHFGVDNGQNDPMQLFRYLRQKHEVLDAWHLLTVRCVRPCEGFQDLTWCITMCKISSGSLSSILAIITDSQMLAWVVSGFDKHWGMIWVTHDPLNPILIQPSVEIAQWGVGSPVLMGLSCHPDTHYSCIRVRPVSRLDLYLYYRVVTHITLLSKRGRYSTD